MRKFQQNVNRELRRATPDRLRYADDDDNGDNRVGDNTADEEEVEQGEEEKEALQPDGFRCVFKVVMAFDVDHVHD